MTCFIILVLIMHWSTAILVQAACISCTGPEALWCTLPVNMHAWVLVSVVLTDIWNMFGPPAVHVSVISSASHL
uniref:Putative secreted protein n=1 Tax=Ixodes ricinus TaxID=34613 RepID=A0A6B0TYN8_IXORI